MNSAYNFDEKLALKRATATALMGVERSLGTAPRNPLNVAQARTLAQTFSKTYYQFHSVLLQVQLR